MNCGRVLEVDDLKYKLAFIVGLVIPVVFFVANRPLSIPMPVFWVGFGVCVIGPLLMVGLLNVRNAFPADE